MKKQNTKQIKPGEMFNAFQKKKNKLKKKSYPFGTASYNASPNKYGGIIPNAYQPKAIQDMHPEWQKFKGKKKKSSKKHKNWIAGAIKKPGALHKELGVSQGKKIPAGKLANAAKKGGKEGKRANLAKTLASFQHKKGKKMKFTKKNDHDADDMKKGHKKHKMKKKISLSGIMGGIKQGASLMGNMGKTFARNVTGHDDYADSLRAQGYGKMKSQKKMKIMCKKSHKHSKMCKK